MPALMRDKCVHICFSRGSEYSKLRQLDGEAGFVGLRARLAKMSRISSVRSSTFTPTAFSRLRVCAGERSLSKITHVGVVGIDQLPQLFDLAFAQVSRHVGHVAALRQLTDDANFRRGGQSVQFIERRLAGRMIGQNDAHEHCGLAGDTIRAVEFNHDRMVTSLAVVSTKIAGQNRLRPCTAGRSKRPAAHAT